MCSDDEETPVLITIRLDCASRDRLLALADLCHADPTVVAASLLHDVLKDDENAHAPGTDEGNVIDLRKYH